MSTILHVTQTGHRCRNTSTISRKDLEQGTIYQVGEYELTLQRGTYYLNHYLDHTADIYEFTNFDCACAQLIALRDGVKA